LYLAWLYTICLVFGKANTNCLVFGVANAICLVFGVANTICLVIGGAMQFTNLQQPLSNARA